MKQKQRGLELSALAKVYPENVACPIPEKQRRQNKGALFNFGTHHAVGNPSPSREPWWSDFAKVHVTHLGMEKLLAWPILIFLDAQETKILGWLEC
jgi:hypothetical protein